MTSALTSAAICAACARIWRASAEAARSAASAGCLARFCLPAFPRMRQVMLKEAEMLLQTFRDDLRVELRRQAVAQPHHPGDAGNRQDGPRPGTHFDPEFAERLSRPCRPRVP